MLSALVLYLLAVAALQVLRTATGHPRPATLAVSPAELWRGEVWRLVTSALPISRVAALELAGMVVAVVLAVRAFGIGVFWIAAALGHIGSTLVAYTGIGVLWLLDPSWVDGLVRDADYGISGVWFAALGLLAAGLAARDRAQGIALLGACLAASVALLALSDTLALAEHVLALVFGTLTGLAALRLRRRPAW